jgi:hypothetical protein
MTDKVLPIAERVIDLCGGAKAVADAIGCKPPAVYRWTYPKDRGGRGGVVPHDKAQILLRKASENGWPLKPSDFFDAD